MRKTSRRFWLLPKKEGSRTLRHVMDVRHESFIVPAYKALAKKHGVSTVFTDADKFPSFEEPEGDVAYARLMMADAKLKTGYGPKALDTWAERAQGWAGLAEEARRVRLLHQRRQRKSTGRGRCFAGAPGVDPAGGRSLGGDQVVRLRVAARLGAEADFARQLAAFFDDDLAVADLAGDLAGRVNDELLAHGEAAVEHAADFGDVDFGRALELALLGDLHQARIHGRFDQAFDHERVAIGDLDALELDVRADGELAAAFLGNGVRLQQRSVRLAVRSATRD
jgi:hypothetical protein